ncbi:MAG: MBOAT family O-acyltransferase [Candidatus Saccharibacteria bacterium]|nr:MBOAT family O-acyltransferase [Candidatus Saccharibacteria bacterium]
MVFSSLIFLFMFLPIFLMCYFIPKNRKVRNVVLLLFSIAFYTYGEPIYILLMLASILFNYFMTRWMVARKNSKFIFVLIIIFNLGLLGLFKYADFFIGNVNNLLGLSIGFLKLSLPIGISFYTFQVLTYVIDVYRKQVKVQKSIINLGCYISAFPQLIAGPIVRYSTVNEELDNRKENVKDFADGIGRFIIGLAKKAIIANEMAYVADAIFGSAMVEAGFIGALIGALAYALQIYFDFSGYSDMAIGLGRMLGFHYLENFDHPYRATSITDFWRRWHISLSSFFRDYVYIPLGGNRCSKTRNIINILVVWALTGLWHGASWNFVIWGLYFGVILILEKFVFKKVLEKMPGVLKHVYALVIILIGWVIFYFTDLSQLGEAFRSLIGLNGLGSIDLLTHLQIFKIRTIVVFVLGMIFSVKAFKLKEGKTLTYIILILLFVLSVIFILASTYNPFIYFRF